jgi:hypothetical protein
MSMNGDLLYEAVRKGKQFLQRRPDASARRLIISSTGSPGFTACRAH